MADRADNANSKELSRRGFIATQIALGTAMVFALAGCEEDKRTVEEKAAAPNPQFATRNVMHCPKCGAPTVPYSLNHTKSFYKCTGQPPKFTVHPEKRWSRRLDVGPYASEK